MHKFVFNDSDLYLSHAYDETPSQNRFYMHTHVHAEVYCFLEGRAVFHVEGTAYALEPGDILLMRPGEAHYVQVDDGLPYERICLNFDTGLLRSLDPEQQLTRPFFAHKAGKSNHYRPEDAQCLQLLRSMTAQRSRPVILGNLILLLQKLEEQFSREGERSADADTLEYRLIRYINKNLEKPLTLESLCDCFFVSRTQLCRLFKQATGTSVGGYINAKRLFAARELLLQGNKPTAVYAACGYRDYSTFFRAYTKYFGHSPREANRYRNAITPDTHILLG